MNSSCCSQNTKTKLNLKSIFKNFKADVKKWKLEKLCYAEKDFTWEQVKQWSMGKMRSSLNFLLSGFRVSIYLQMCYVEVLMRPASFSNLMLVSLCSNTEHFCMFWQTVDSCFSTDDSIQGFSGWFKLKSPSSVLNFKGFFSRLSPTPFFKPYNSPRPFPL